MIILVRHAKVIINSSVVYAKDMGTFIKKYNEANIETELPNGLLEADIYISSTLKRSIESIKLLGKQADIEDEIFNEADLPYADWMRIKLAVKVWAILFRIAWIFGYSKHSESYRNAKKRAILATNVLIEQEKNNQGVLLVGHGIMNKLILNVLKNRGYNLVKTTGNGNWDYAVLQSNNKE